MLTIFFFKENLIPMYGAIIFSFLSHIKYKLFLFFSPEIKLSMPMITRWMRLHWVNVT